MSFESKYNKFCAYVYAPSGTLFFLTGIGSVYSDLENISGYLLTGAGAYFMCRGLTEFSKLQKQKDLEDKL